MKTDQEIQEDVQAELKWEPSVNDTNIGVAVNDGIVTVSGSVANYFEKWAAEKAVGRVKGVKGVAEELEVHLNGSDTHSDRDIVSASVNALGWYSTVPADQVHVQVENGVITLQGEVEWKYQKDAAESAVANLMGVKGVMNLLTIQKQPASAQVEESIKQAFARHAVLDAKQITLDMTDGEVILTGSVNSWGERQDAVDAAWAAPGVTSVKNHLLVNPFS